MRRGDEHVDQAELARLENALAAAQADAGQWEAARASFARAAAAARSAGAAAAFARAALGHAGGTWEQYGVEDTENVALLEEALRRLPAEDSPMRAQVLARIAVHRRFVRAGRRGGGAGDRGRGGRDGAPARRAPAAGGGAGGRPARPLAAPAARRTGWTSRPS